MSVQPALQEREAASVERMQAAVAELKPALAAYAREHGGRFILFGSAARREMHPDSDVDILVDFPLGSKTHAISFAEDACWERGLKPDILGFGWPAGRLLQHIEEEGLIFPGDEERWSNPMSNEDRWGDILEAARSAGYHFRAAERVFHRGGLEGAGDEGYERRMAFYHAMQTGHTALESALKRVLAVLGARPPAGSEWHQELIQQAARPQRRRGPVLSPELVAAADETRSFRHFASHAYDQPFDRDTARPALEAAQLIADRLEGELQDFKDRISSL